MQSFQGLLCRLLFRQFATKTDNEGKIRTQSITKQRQAVKCGKRKLSYHKDDHAMLAIYGRPDKQHTNT